MSRIHSFDGKLICSNRDPNGEADNWVSQFLNLESNVYILGLGAGYHLEKFIEKFPLKSVCVIDNRGSLLNSFRNHSRMNLNKVQFAILNEASELFQLQIINDWAFEKVSILNFYPCQQCDKEFYLNLNKHLKGKSKESSKFYCDRLGLDWDLISRKEELKNYNIKEFNSLFDGQIKSEQKNIFSLLRELVR